MSTSVADSLRAALIACRALPAGAKGGPPPEVEAAEQMFSTVLQLFADQYTAVIGCPPGGALGLHDLDPSALELRKLYLDSKTRQKQLHEAITGFSSDPDRLNGALVSCIGVAPAIEAQVAALDRRDGAPRSRRAQLLRLVPPVCAAVAGVLLLIGLDYFQRSALRADLHEHVHLARQAAAAAKDDGIGATNAVTLIAAGDSAHPHAARIPTPIEARAIGRDLVSGQVNVETALDALNRVQAVEHENAIENASTLTVNVGRASGMNETLKKIATDFEGRAVPVLSRDTLARNAWIAQAQADASTLVEAASALGAAALSADVQLAGLSDTAKVTLDRKRDSINAIFDGRSALQFIGRVLFAMAYLMIGGATLLLLAGVFGMADARATINDLIKGVATGSTKAASLIWGLVAPIGLAATLATGLVAAKPVLKSETPTDDHSHVRLAAPVTDSAAVAKMLKAIIDTVGEVKRTTRAIGDRAY